MIKHTALASILALSLVPSWADAPYQCSGSNFECTASANVGAMSSQQLDAYINQLQQENAEAKVKNDKQKLLATLPQLQEFYVPLQTASTVLGAMFGSLHRQNKQIEAYWQGRKSDLDTANSQCMALSDNTDIKECINNVRQAEIRKTQAIQQQNQQQVSAVYITSAYMQQAALNLGNQMRQNYSAPVKYSRPVNYNCSSQRFGTMVNTNCYGY